MTRPGRMDLLIAPHLNLRAFGAHRYRHCVPAAKRLEVAIGDKTLSLSNLDKVLYPRVGFTKGQVIDYYTRIAPVLLPHLRDRPLTLKRYPNGVEDKFFYEKRCPSHAPTGCRRPRVVGPQRGQHRLLSVPGPADAGLAGEPGRSRAAHADGARAGHAASDDRRL